MGVGHDIDAADGQHALQVGWHMIRVGSEIGVDAGGEAIKVGAHLRGLRLVPDEAACRCVVGDQIAIERGIVRPPIFRRPRPAFAIHFQQDVAVAGGLRPAEALEGAGFGGGLDVGDTIFVPQHFVRQRGSGGGQQQGQRGGDNGLHAWFPPGRRQVSGLHEAAPQEIADVQAL